MVKWLKVAHANIIDQIRLLFSNLLDSLTPKQINSFKIK